MGSRGILDEPESGSMQPDFMPRARDVVALVQHSPPQHTSYDQDALFLVSFYRVNNDTSFFELLEFSVAHLDSPGELLLI